MYERYKIKHYLDRYHFLIFLFATIITLTSLLVNHIGQITQNPFGLLLSLPRVTIIGLFVMLILCCLHIDSKYSKCMLIITFVAIWNLTLIEPYAPVYDSYYHYQNTLAIFGDNIFALDNYHGLWPGFLQIGGRSLTGDFPEQVKIGGLSPSCHL